MIIDPLMHFNFNVAMLNLESNYNVFKINLVEVNKQYLPLNCCVLEVKSSW